MNEYTEATARGVDFLANRIEELEAQLAQERTQVAALVEAATETQDLLNRLLRDKELLISGTYQKAIESLRAALLPWKKETKTDVG